MEALRDQENCDLEVDELELVGQADDGVGCCNELVA